MLEVFFFDHSVSFCSLVLKSLVRYLYFRIAKLRNKEKEWEKLHISVTKLEVGVVSSLGSDYEDTGAWPMPIWLSGGVCGYNYERRFRRFPRTSVCCMGCRRRGQYGPVKRQIVARSRLVKWLRYMRVSGFLSVSFFLYGFQYSTTHLLLVYTKDVQKKRSDFW
jgi:hypothetical protein